MPNPNPAPKITKTQNEDEPLHLWPRADSTPQLCETPLLGVSMKKNIWGRRQEAATRTFWTLVVFWGFVFWGAVNEGLLQKETKKNIKGESSSSWSQFMTFHEKSHLFSFHPKIGAVSELFINYTFVDNQIGHSIPHLLLIRTECLRRRTHALQQYVLICWNLNVILKNTDDNHKTMQCEDYLNENTLMCSCVAAWMELSNVVDIWPNVMDSKFLVHCCFCFAYIWGDFLWNRSCPWLEIPHGNMHHSNQWSRVCRRADEGNAHHQKPGEQPMGWMKRRYWKSEFMATSNCKACTFWRRDSHMQCWNNFSWIKCDRTQQGQKNFQRLVAEDCWMQNDVTSNILEYIHVFGWP